MLIRLFFAISIGIFFQGGCNKEALFEKICVPSAFRCSDASKPEICNEYGSAWIDSQCDENQICITDCDTDENCLYECKEILCQPGKTVCSEDHLYVYTCDATGTGICYSYNCGSINGVCHDGECVAMCSMEQKSYLGCEYYAVDLDNANVPCDTDIFGQIIYCDASASQFAVVISNPDPIESASIIITKGDLQFPQVDEVSIAECVTPDLPENYIDASIIPPKGIEVFKLPRRDANGTIKATLAYRIASNIPVSAYQFNPLENENVFSNDASLLLPVTAAGTDYWVMTREQIFDDLKGFLTVVGIHDNPTDVTVTVTAKTLAGEGIAAMNAGETYSTQLHKYEVLNIETNQIGADLTGSRVQASASVLVFGGNEAANAPTTSLCNLATNRCAGDPDIACGCSEEDGVNCSPHKACVVPSLITCCADHLEQQIFPVSSWGKNYIAVRSFPRNLEHDIWRVMASEDNTDIVLNPNFISIPQLNKGKFYEFETDKDFTLVATKPVLLGQFLAAEQAPDPGNDATTDAKTGDPAFILSVPIRQFRDSYVFIAPDKYEFDYVSIAKKTTGIALLNGVNVEETSGILLQVIPETEWTAIRVPISDGFHTLYCADTCSVMVHGYDQYVSYGYPGGLNLKDQ